MWSGKSQLPYSQRMRSHGLTSSELGVRTWDPMWSGKSQLPYSQRLRLHGLTSSEGKSQLPYSQRLRSHGLTSSELGVRTWDPMWSGKSQLPYSQRLRLHGLTSSKVGVRTWSPNFHALNGGDRMDCPQVKWRLGTLGPLRVAKGPPQKPPLPS